MMIMDCCVGIGWLYADCLVYVAVLELNLHRLLRLLLPCFRAVVSCRGDRI